MDAILRTPVAIPRYTWSMGGEGGLGERTTSRHCRIPLGQWPRPAPWNCIEEEALEVLSQSGQLIQYFWVFWNLLSNLLATCPWQQPSTSVSRSVGGETRRQGIFPITSSIDLRALKCSCWSRNRLSLHTDLPVLQPPWQNSSPIYTPSVEAVVVPQVEDHSCRIFLFYVGRHNRG
jgi:hypothetical protein